MGSESHTEWIKIRKRVALYNQLLNFFWSILCFTPLVYFCYIAVEPRWLYSLLAVSLITFVLPKAFFNAIQLSRTTARYNRLGIRTVKKFTQDGDWVNRLVRKQFPHYQPSRAPGVDPAFLRVRFNRTYFYEKFHAALFLFFFLISVYAVYTHHLGWAVSLTFLNGIYNLYPIWLQQYNRLRLMRLMPK